MSEEQTRKIHRGRITGWRDEPVIKPKYPPGVRKRVQSFGRIRQEKKE